MAGTHGQAASTVIEFTAQNLKHLDGEVKAELGFSIPPSRRSWDAVVRVEAAAAASGFSNDSKFEVMSGLVGREMASAFGQFALPVKPRDVLQHGVKRYESKLRNLKRNEIVGLCWGLISFSKEQIDDEKIANTCLDVAEFLLENKSSERDVVVAYVRALTPTHSRHAITNKEFAKLMADFGKKSGSKKTLIDWINARPALQQLLADVAWGNK